MLGDSWSSYSREDGDLGAQCKSQTLEKMDKTLSWITAISEMISELGVMLHHPNEKLQMPAESCKVCVQVAEKEVEKHAKEVEDLIKELDCQYEEILVQTFEQRRFWSESRTRNDIENKSEEHTRSRPYLENKRIAFLSDKEVLCYLKEKGTYPVAFQQLLLMKRYWKLLRIQIKIINIQLRSESNESVSSNFVQKTSNNEKFQDFWNRSGKLTPFFPKVEFLTSNDFGKISASSCFESYDSGMESEEKSSETLKPGLASCHISPRDDGYCSKVGETTTEEDFSQADAHLLEADSAVQADSDRQTNRDPPTTVAFDEASSRTISRELELSLLRDTSIDVRLSYSKPSSRKWGGIHEVVDRFCSNVVVTLSWIDELKEILQTENYSPKFFNSQSARKVIAQSHVDRLYSEVLEDAASLLRNLPSERSTVFTVLENIEIQLLKCGIFIGDDLTELSRIEPTSNIKDHDCELLSSKLRTDLSSCYPRSLPEDFPPQLTSSPRPVSWHYSRESSEPPKYRLRKCRRGADEVNIKYNITEQKRKEFLNEYKSMLEWLKNMYQSIINIAVTNAVKPAQNKHLFKIYLNECFKNQWKKDNLEVIAKKIIKSFPNVEEEIQQKMKHFTLSWQTIIYHLKILSNSVSTPTEAIWEISRKLKEALCELEAALCESVFYPELSRIHRPKLLERKKLSSLFEPDGQLSDFTFHQIRDQFYLGRRPRRSLVSEESALADTALLLHRDNVLSLPADLSPRSQFESSSFPSSWPKFEGLEREIDKKNLEPKLVNFGLRSPEAALEMTCKPNVALVAKKLHQRGNGLDENITERQLRKFRNQYKSMMQWLKKMDQLISEVETNAVKPAEKKHSYEIYNKAIGMKDKLENIADTIQGICPNVEEEIQQKMKHFTLSWQELINRLNRLLTAFTPTDAIWKIPKKAALCESVCHPVLSRIHRQSLERKKLSSLFEPDGQLCDFTFHQIRDQFYLGRRPRRSLVSEEPALADTALLLHRDNVLSLPADLSPRSQFELSSFPSSWPKFEGLESEIDKKNFFIGQDAEDCCSGTERRHIDSPATASSEDTETESTSHCGKIEVAWQPGEVLNNIQAFHRLLKSFEQDVYSLYESEGIGWDPSRVQLLLYSNQNRQVKLQEENQLLKQIMAASESLLRNHGREVSEYCLLWSSWMLERRYFNLILFTVDMECILERRIEIITKGSTEKRLSHPIEGTWSDCGVDMRPEIETTDEDYDIFWPF